MRLRCLLRLILLLAAARHGSALRAQLANQPPQPVWLEAGDSEQKLEKHFTHEGKLLKAILLGASEDDAEVFVNGTSAGKIAPAPKATSGAKRR